jgi:hypothetical protein
MRPRRKGRLAPTVSKPWKYRRRRKASLMASPGVLFFAATPSPSVSEYDNNHPPRFCSQPLDRIAIRKALQDKRRDHCLR